MTVSGKRGPGQVTSITFATFQRVWNSRRSLKKIGQVYHMRSWGHLSRSPFGGASSKPPRREGVVDRIAVSGEGTSPAWVSLIEEAVPHCGGSSCTCRGGRTGTNSDTGAGAGISAAFASHSRFGGERTVIISAKQGGQKARRPRPNAFPQSFSAWSFSQSFSPASEITGEAMCVIHAQREKEPTFPR